MQTKSDKDQINPYVERIDAELPAIIATLPEPGDDATPPYDPPPWPREQMTVMYRHIATDAGLPRRCPERRCRRAGVCHGGLAADHCHSCEPLWDDGSMQRLDAALIALIVAWCWEYCRHEHLFDGP